MEIESTFNPKDCISGKMMRLNRLTANVFRKYLKPFNVTDSQLTLLFILSKKKNLSQKALSEIALLEKSSLNRNLRRLIEANLISNGNKSELNLTTKGKNLVEKIILNGKRR